MSRQNTEATTEWKPDPASEFVVTERNTRKISPMACMLSRFSLRMSTGSCESRCHCYVAQGGFRRRVESVACCIDALPITYSFSECGGMFEIRTPLVRCREVQWCLRWERNQNKPTWWRERLYWLIEMFAFVFIRYYCFIAWKILFMIKLILINKWHITVDIKAFQLRYTLGKIVTFYWLRALTYFEYW